MLASGRVTSSQLQDSSTRLPCAARHDPRRVDARRARAFARLRRASPIVFGSAVAQGREAQCGRRHAARGRGAQGCQRRNAPELRAQAVGLRPAHRRSSSARIRRERDALRDEHEPEQHAARHSRPSHVGAHRSHAEDCRRPAPVLPARSSRRRAAQGTSGCPTSIRTARTIFATSSSSRSGSTASRTATATAWRTPRRS